MRRRHQHHMQEVRASGALDFDFSRARRAPRPSGLGLGFGFGLGLNVLSPIEYKHSVHVHACVSRHEVCTGICSRWVYSFIRCQCQCRCQISGLWSLASRISNQVRISYFVFRIACLTVPVDIRKEPLQLRRREFRFCVNAGKGSCS